MKMISKEIQNGKDVITTESKFLFWKRIHVFEAQTEFLLGCWDWIELPNRKLIGYTLSFQLNAWNKL